MISESFIKKNKEVSEKLERDVQDFIARGGKVKVIQSGISGQNEYKNFLRHVQTSKFSQQDTGKDEEDDDNA